MQDPLSTHESRRAPTEPVRLGESLAKLLFPNLDQALSLDELESRYPKRALIPNAKVTRFAPSPTGFLHLGAIYTAMINKLFTVQNDGVFILRIEDTDQNRLVTGAVETIVKCLKQFNLSADEGSSLIEDNGAYGPYQQSKRLDIYQSAIIHLLRKGLAYPCFCSSEELKNMRATQKKLKEKPGYYGSWATWRDAPLEKVEAALQEGKPFVIRFRSTGTTEDKISWNDGIQKKSQMGANDSDQILFKSDGFPTYHLAHVVDDHFMRTTDVIRDNQWLNSVPFHLELFKAFGWQAPKYSHCPPLMKKDGKSKKKLSKRKDPEANVETLLKEGYPPSAILEYLLNIANSNFEDWRKQNPSLSIDDFKLQLANFSSSGALVDPDKLKNVSQGVIARMDVRSIYRQTLAWASAHRPKLAYEITADKNYTLCALNIERNKKRLSSWGDLRTQLDFFYDSLYQQMEWPEYPETTTVNIRAEVLTKAPVLYDLADSKEAWFTRMKTLTENLGYAPTLKEFNKNPNSYPGHIGNIMMILRIALCKSPNSPGLYEVMQVMGKKRVSERLEQARF